MKDQELIDNFIRSLKLDDPVKELYSAPDEPLEERAEESSDSKDILRVLQQDRIRSMRDTLDDILQFIALRQSLNKEIFYDIEKINCWRDIAALKKELRERLQEFKQQESKVGIIDTILE